MRLKHIPIEWIVAGEHRLDCGPFTKGGTEARLILEATSLTKQSLAEVTRDGISGIYHVGMDKLEWVYSPEFGVPFLRSSDINRSDLAGQPLISRRQVERNCLFKCPIGTTLVTRSGTIGRMAYCREDMANMAISQDVLKILPETDVVRSGYLYAYLSSRYGIPLVTSGTFGSIIVHIEAGNIADLPVPRLEDDVEERVHALIEKAAVLRTRAASLRRAVLNMVTTELGWLCKEGGSYSLADQVDLQRRMDAFYHSAKVVQARSCLAKSDSTKRLGDVALGIFEPNRGPRIKVVDPEYGVPFLSSSEVFRLDPKGEYLVSRSKTPCVEGLIIGQFDVLIPRSGQIGGIIGKPVLPLQSYYGSAASEHLVRVRCNTRDDAYFAWAILATEPGYYALVGTAFGSSIPSLDCQLIADLVIPWWEDRRRSEVVDVVTTMVDALYQAIVSERAAVSIVEQAIEESA